MKNKGWVKLYRAQFTHEISKKPWCDSYAWCYLYSQANYKPGFVCMRNEYIQVKRGQFVTSKKKLAELFGWTKSHLNNFLFALNTDHMITYRMTHRYTLITIEKYSAYQDRDTENSPQNDPQSGRQTADRQPTERHKQEGIKNDLRKVKKLSNSEIKENSERVTKAKNEFLDIVKKKKAECKEGG